MFSDYVSVDQTVGYLEYVDEFTSVYEIEESEVDVSQVLDSI